MKHLREKDIAKFSSISGVPVVELVKLRAIGALDESAMIGHMVRYDFDHIQKYGKYTIKQITEAICLEYQISKTMVHNALYEKRRHEYGCRRCGSPMGKSAYARNSGLCDTCKAEEIKNELL